MKDRKDVAAIVMAGGMGTRMRSPISKMLMPVLGRPLVAYAVETALAVIQGPVVVVAGDALEGMKVQLEGIFPAERLRFARQEKPLGTADAVRAGMTQVTDSEAVAILNGDVPNLPAELAERLIQKFEKATADLSVLAFHTETPHGYGRIIHDDSGRILAIREQKELREGEEDIELVNAGVYVARAKVLREFLQTVQPSPTQQEYLLTDLVEYVYNRGGQTKLVTTADPSAVEGVNNRAQLADATRLVRQARNRQLMLDGVSMPQPDTVDVDFGVSVGRNVTLEAGVAIRGKCSIGDNTHVGRGVVMEDTAVGAGVTIRPYCVLESSVIGDGCSVGPFAHTRAGTVLKEKAKLGNFVETKKTVIGKGSKASHLSYLGDATIGEGVNVGAGTITCNYDGYKKYHTVLEDGVFIGSDTQLVAPVTVGKDAVVAAGTTVTQDVPPGALALSRTPQTHVEGYAARKRTTMTQLPKGA